MTFTIKSESYRNERNDAEIKVQQYSDGFCKLWRIVIKRDAYFWSQVYKDELCTKPRRSTIEKLIANI